ncbi:MAG TPA: cupredoxin domain-containing protein [Chloroflexota bacterium]|nr:cupredoxin domain-containing protein [Chloroflexota bacterium]
MALALSGCGSGKSASAATPTPHPIVISSTSTVASPTPEPSPADAVPTALTPFVPPPTATPSGTPAPPNTVRITDFAFTPPSLTVKVGTSVIWTNLGPSNHTVTSNDGLFDSKVVQRNGTFTYTFSKAGTYAYHCQIHPTMNGTVIVTA